MTHLKLILDRRRRLSNGSYPIVFRISFKGKTRDINTGLHANENHWNSKLGRCKKSLLGYEKLNEHLEALEYKYINGIIEYKKTNGADNMDVQQVKDYLLNKSPIEHTVLSFWEREIGLIQKANRNSGARIYIETLIAFKKIRNLDISFEAIDHKYLKEVEVDFISKKLKVNTISLYFRTLRALYNKAIHDKLVSYEAYPFRTFKIKREATRPRVLSLDEIQRFFNLSIEKSSIYYESWLIGKLMFMLVGINYKDLVLMTESQIQHGRLIYIRSKTKRQYSIKLLPEAMEIIKYFKEKKAETILGRINTEQLKDKKMLPLTIRQSIKVFNVHLKALGKMINSNEKITGYCMRYTTANISRQLGYSKDLISEALGHSIGLRVTGIYLENFDLDIIDRMNEHVCNTVMGKS